MLGIEQSSSVAITAASDEALLGLFLARLRRLLQQRSDRLDALNAEGVRLLDQSIFSTYCDCRALGGAAIASGLVQTVMQQAPSAGEPTRVEAVSS